MEMQTTQRIKPTTIPHTKRQRVTTQSGVLLERAYLFMPEESWNELQRLCIASHQSGSQVIQQLISTATIGNQKDNTNDQSRTRTI